MGGNGTLSLLGPLYCQFSFCELNFSCQLTKLRMSNNAIRENDQPHPQTICPEYTQLFPTHFDAFPAQNRGYQSVFGQFCPFITRLNRMGNRLEYRETFPRRNTLTLPTLILS